jgi:tetratricopeptide (TPR) repeat protein
MSKNKYILFFALVLFSLATSAQKAERNYIRKGNRCFKDSTYVKAEVNYRKALDVNHKSSISMYNLGNALSQQKKLNDAMKMYQSASKIEKNKSRLAQIYHNMGVLFLAAKDYENAVKACSLSLLNNPNDEETRYNLALAKKMLKKQPQNKNKNKNKDKNKDKQKQNQQQQKKDQNKNNPPKPQKSNSQMSKQNADQLLNAVMQEEKGTQNKMKNQQSLQGNHLEKNW